MLLSAAHLGSALIFRSLLQILFKSLQALRTLSIPLWLLLIFVYFLTTSSCSHLVCVWYSWGKKTATSRKECAVIPHSRSIVFHKWVTLTILRRCFIFTQESGCYICVTGVLISVFVLWFIYFESDVRPFLFPHFRYRLSALRFLLPLLLGHVQNMYSVWVGFLWILCFSTFQWCLLYSDDPCILVCPFLTSMMFWCRGDGFNLLVFHKNPTCNGCYLVSNGENLLLFVCSGPHCSSMQVLIICFKTTWIQWKELPSVEGSWSCSTKSLLPNSDEGTSQKWFFSPRPACVITTSPWLQRLRCQWILHLY